MDTYQKSAKPLESARQPRQISRHVFHNFYPIWILGSAGEMFNSGIFILAICNVTILGETNISEINRFAWSENSGWTSWRDPAGESFGVFVGNTILSGEIWNENAGWMSLGDGDPQDGRNYSNVNASDFGVNVSPTGALYGFAWCENLGWVNFEGGDLAIPSSPARIDCDGTLSGWVWSENAGWINLGAMESPQFVSLAESSIPLRCDANRDGSRNAMDIEFFIDAVIYETDPDWRLICLTDVGEVADGQITLDDVPGFVACLLGE